MSQTKYIIGSDEVGLGALAGPLFVCAVAVPENWQSPAGLTDSKKLTPFDRARIYGEGLQRLPMFIASAENVLIDDLGISDVLMHSHREAIKALLETFPDADIVIDGVRRPDGLPSRARCVPRADSLFPAVSAASVIAKVNRDFVMRQYHELFPHYGWDTNMGYPAKAHKEGLKKYGVTYLHRRSYAPIKKLLEEACTSTAT